MDNIEISDVIEFASCRANLRRDGAAQSAINLLLEADPADQLRALVVHVAPEAQLPPGGIWVEAAISPRQRAELRRANAPQISLTGSLVIVDVALLPSGGARVSGRLERLDEARPASLLSGGRVIRVPAREAAAAAEATEAAPRRRMR